jgi:hypothetical protein
LATPTTATSSLADTILQLHWLGKHGLATNKEAANFMSVWSLPESQKLEQQTLDKLAVWVAGQGAENRGQRTEVRGQQTLPKSTNQAQPSAASLPPSLSPLRGLLEDLLNEESYLEVRQSGTDQAATVLLAIRLPEARAAVWQTNLPALNARWHIECGRSGEWTLVGAGVNGKTLIPDFAARIQREHIASNLPQTKDWMEVKANMSRVAAEIGLAQPAAVSALPFLSLSVNGNGTVVRTIATLDFPKRLELELEPWFVPTNLIHSPVASFEAIRGIGAWLSGLQAWTGLGIGAAPNQFYMWAQQSFPFHAFCAAPAQSNWISQLDERVLTDGNAWMSQNAMGNFVATTNGVAWKNTPFMAPYLQPAAAGGREFVFGGLAPNPETNQPPPPALLEAFLGRTNLVAYEWELTASRMEAWLYVGQLLRVIFHQAQLPAKSAAIGWVKAAGLKLGICATVITQSSPQQLTVVRNSSVGLSALELHLLMDWPESPQFPYGLYTMLAPSSVSPTSPGQ